ncbi:hypothetical protein BU15DRAFT_84828 [Melanogaster broomeanus]|nr:hypothetical protein BU15DRAFT_84828 [Melanogaster broomeanus]
MSFRPRNAYYLRISANIVLPLYLYLDERHIDWMSDVVLQHVLADLRPLVIPKLQGERDIHFGPGTAPGDKKGTVEVHRGETYQFAYFFRKTEPHSVVTKSRYFVAAPPPSEAAPVPALAAPLPRLDHSKKRRKTQPSAKHSNRKRAKTKGKHKASDSHIDEDILSSEESEQDSDGEAGPQLVTTEPRRSQRQRRVLAGGYRENDEEGVEDADAYQDVDMAPPPTESNGRSPAHSSDSLNASTDRCPAPDVKTEEVDQSFPVVTEGDEDIALDRDGQPILPHNGPEIDLVVEEEEERKPKPLLKLRYQSFTISGHCLCVVVEPWPLQRAVTRLQSVAPLGAVSQRGSIASAHFASGESNIAGQRAQTPLFLPELDRAPSETPYPRGRTLPPVPLFHDDTSANDEDDGYNSDDLMNFSQVLNSTGHMHANTADDDDDMDGAVLFGDADEVREFL